MWKSPKSHLRRDLSDLSVSETSRLMTLQTCIQNNDPKYSLTSHGCETKSSPIKNTLTSNKTSYLKCHCDQSDYQPCWLSVRS